MNESAASSASVPLMAGGQPIQEAVADQAAEWLTLLMSGEASAEDRQRWRQWHGADPDHARAWKHIEAVTWRLKGLPPALGYQALSHYVEPSTPGRRQALRLVLWGSVAGGVAFASLRSPAWQQLAADHRTGTGEQRSIDLPDGSRLLLNTASAVDVRFDAKVRLLHLVAGEVCITSDQVLRADRTADPRPLIVETAEGRIRALGTRFSVRQWPERTHVAVQESAVELHPAAAESMPRTLRAGEHAWLTRDAASEPQAAGAHDDAWTRGQLVADDLPLGAFLAELTRYRRGVLRCDPAVAGWRLSGVFPLHDTDRILALLPHVLPLLVRVRTRYWVSVEAA